MEIIDGGDCSNSYKYSKSLFPHNIISEQLCATNPNATNFTCQVTSKDIFLYHIYIWENNCDIMISNTNHIFREILEVLYK